jgi:hypothetical protein
MADRGDVADTDLAAHRKARKTKLQARGQVTQDANRVVAAGEAVAHHAHPMASRRLTADQIRHMPEQAADGRAQYMQDAQGTGGLAHGAGAGPDWLIRVNARTVRDSRAAPMCLRLLAAYVAALTRQ